MSKLLIEPKITSVKKFYFLEYFYILLKSVEQHQSKKEIFSDFRRRKDSFQLGESKYRKIITPDEEMSSKKLKRYEYTLKEVIEESKLYNLIESRGEDFFLTTTGKNLINNYERNLDEYHLAIFNLMERELHGFYYLIQKCYSASKSGLLIFPVYSPLRLNIAKESFKKTADVINYINLLVEKLRSDIKEHLNIEQNLSSTKENLIAKLVSAGLIDLSPEAPLKNADYNVIVKRIRDHWLNYFLNDIYKMQMSLSYFDIWCYRGKQLGIINATEFYYNFSGKIVYPISILTPSVSNRDFLEIFQYPENIKLFIHSPSFENMIEEFTKCVYESYIDLKSRVKTYFVNLADLRDLVCFKLKISYNKFVEFLESLYQLNLRNETKISISLEADRLPSETKAMYLKREPIVVDNKSLNIIAIDIKK
ncbi:hypothetical protein [Filimonas effusa]|uniref:Uncharacterized protein n=1 Tax=Filimonas effusa TaxID=2508721 RepID=A0A4Q1DAC8_9BACT|nr:hypothetical protein [Filimonas effusa]RXK86190.1 hypothetical protein ESB13_05110 [Filimonas effusa]